AAFLRVPGAEDLDLANVAEREPPAERDQPGGAAGKGAQHLGALGVAGDGRVGQSPRGDGVERPDLLAGRPADLVELMDGHVHEDPPAARAEARWRRLLVPLIAGGEIEVTQLATDDARLQRLQAGHEAPPVGDLERYTGGSGDGGRFLPLAGAEAAVLLAEARNSGRR